MPIIKKIIIISILFFAIVVCTNAKNGKVILFDENHAESCGNADWLIDHAYSDWADVLKKQGFEVKGTGKKNLNKELFSDVSVFVIPEPNTRFTKEEVIVIREYLDGGGSLFAIGDHIRSDRNKSGIDSVGILNDIISHYGMEFEEKILTEGPVYGRIIEHPAIKYVQSLPCWAGTSIKITNEKQVKGLYYFSNQKDAYIAAYDDGKTKILSVGDSSVFDDGTGDPKKKLHNVFNSIKFTIPQFALSSICWLSGVKPGKLSLNSEFEFITDLKKNNKKYSKNIENKKIIGIDCTHGNIDVDQMHIWLSDLKKYGYAPFFIIEKWTADILDKVNILVVTDCFIPYSEDELLIIKKFHENSGNIFMLGKAHFRSSGHSKFMNQILEVTGSSIRLNNDQVKNDMEKKPWVFKVTDLIEEGFKDVAFWAWSTASLSVKPEKNCFVIGFGPIGCYSSNSPEVKDRKIPLVAAEMGRGKNGNIIVLGCSTLSNYQYPERREKYISYVNKNIKVNSTKELKDTGLFNIRILGLFNIK
ncbi:hypothetical protein KAJ27_22725 [bacterium]|nr:hypothetical protein [bacterium]